MMRHTSVAKPGFAPSALDVLTFAIGVAQFYTLPFIGTLPMGEVLGVLFLPVILHQTRTERRALEYRVPYILLAVWGLAQLVSNIANQVSTEAMVKGLAAVLFVFLDLVILRLLLRGYPKRQVLFGVGLLVADILRIYAGQEEGFVSAGGSLADNWKFGWGPIVSSIAALVCCYCFSKRKYLVGVLFVVFAGSASLYYNARSQYLITVLSAIIVAPIFRSPPDGDARIVRRAGVLKFVTVLVAVGVTGSVLGSIYSYTAEHGLLGEDARGKYEEQALASGGLLLEARPEIVPDLMAIRDSPLLGYGYRGTGSQYAAEYLFRAETAVEETGAGSVPDNADDEIPAHSFLLGAWVWSGFFGTLFWFYLLYLVARGIFEMTLAQNTFNPYYSLLATLLVWSIFCSPFGLATRMQTAFDMVILLDVIRRGKPSAPQKSVPVNERHVPGSRMRALPYRALEGGA